MHIHEKSLARLSGGLKIPTVGSTRREDIDFAPFEEFKRYLEASYPQIYGAMQTRCINDYSLVFQWKGKNSSLAPILFLSHYDVVPAKDTGRRSGDAVFKPDGSPYGPVLETQRHWEYPPFSGAVANGRIYGRGALDMKGMLFAVMEAADRLLAEGFQPERDIWFAFGHDEETGGTHGAASIADYFASKGLFFDAVFDEGGLIGMGGAIMKGITQPVAAVGLGEKGFLTLNIKVRGAGGHSSMPPAKSSLVLASEIALLLNKNQLPVHITPPVAEVLKKAKDADPGGQAREAGRNGNGQKDALSEVPIYNALMRTTTAITMMRGSDAPNVLSSVSELVVNFRILHGDTIKSVTEHVRGLCKGYDVEITVLGSAREPSHLTDVNAKGFSVIKKIIKRIYPDTLVLPYITIGGTDAYKYRIVSDSIYRFMPVRINSHELETIHNENEHISIENYTNMIDYFYLIMNAYEEYQ